MGAASYQELFQEKLSAFRDQRRNLQAWQCRLELKRLHPGLYQAVFGRDDHEKLMGAVDYHLAEGHAIEAAYELIALHAPELVAELNHESIEEV